MKQKIVDAYLRQAMKNCPIAFRRRLRKALESDLLEYLEQTSDFSPESVNEHFGAPEKYADEYILSMDEETRSNTVRNAKKVAALVIIGVIAVVSIAASTAVWIIHTNAQSLAYYYSEEIVG